MDNCIAIWVPILPEQGLGHFYRTYAIYESIPTSFYFFNTKIKKKINERYSQVESESPVEIIDYLKSKHVRTLIIDNYFIKAEILIALEKEKFRIIFFDKYNENYKFDASWNNNPFIDIKAFRQNCQAQLTFLGGAYYFFRNSLIEKKNRLKKEKSIFICIGGSDPLGLTKQLIPILPKGFHYDIILGRGCSDEYIDSIVEIAPSYLPSYQIHKSPDNFFEIFSSCEYSILSSSTVTYESSFLDVPFIAIQTAQNQDDLVSFLKDNDINVITEINKIKDIAQLINKQQFGILDIDFGKQQQQFISYLLEE